MPSGGGLSLPMRSLIRGSACRRSRRRSGRGAELVAVLVVVALEPAGADAEDRAAAGDVVDRAVRVGQQLRVAVGVADHQRADLRALGDRGHRAERRDRLEVLAVGFAVERDRSGPSRRSSRRRAPRPRARRGACRRSRRAGAGPVHRCESKPSPHGSVRRMSLDDLHPWTVAVHAGRGERVANAPLNQPLVLASNLRGGGSTAARTARRRGPRWRTRWARSRAGGVVGSRPAWRRAAVVIYALGARVVGSDGQLPRVRSLLAEHAAQGRARAGPGTSTDTAAVLAAADGADIVWVETPTNPTLDVADLAGICAGPSRPTGVPMVVDSTFATPLRQRPLDSAPPSSMHSATKFIGGHCDLMIGRGHRGRRLAERLRHVPPGSSARRPARWRSFLALRGLRTLPVRLPRGSATAQQLAERLAAHPASRGPLPGAARPPRARARRPADGRLRRHALVRARTAAEIAERVQSKSVVCTTRRASAASRP